MFEKIQIIISNITNINKENIKLNSSLNELQIDSLDLFEVVNKIEEEFNVSIDGYGVENIKTIEDIINAIKKSGN